MTHDELGQVLRTIAEPQEDLAVCQNPQCWEGYIADPAIPDDDPDSLLCPECRRTLEPVDRWNVKYACENGLEPGQILRAVMNGQTR